MPKFKFFFVVSVLSVVLGDIRKYKRIIKKKQFDKELAQNIGLKISTCVSHQLRLMGKKWWPQKSVDHY